MLDPSDGLGERVELGVQPGGRARVQLGEETLGADEGHGRTIATPADA